MGASRRCVGEGLIALLMVGLQCDFLDSGRQPKKRKRYLILSEPDLIALQHLPAVWQQLMRDYLKLGSNSRWSSWQKLAGLTHKNDLDSLYDWLLRYGFIFTYESFKNGEWWPYKIEWQHTNLLRKALGLKVPEEQQSALQQLLQGLSEHTNDDQRWLSLIASLATFPVGTALRRAQLLQSLRQWQQAQRIGSHRDFALFSRGDTKALSSSEWAWIESQLDLSDYGIQPHTPLLYIAANMQFQLSSGVLDIAPSQPFIALPISSLATLTAIRGAQLRAWIVVENLTSFERVAAKREADTAVVWLPGFAPGWWQQLMSLMIRLCPAPLQIACDPDPSGVSIALNVMQLWQSQQLEAHPWCMGVAELRQCQHRKSLDMYDQRRLLSLLQMLPELHPTLAALVQYMQDTQQKAEQESYL